MHRLHWNVAWCGLVWLAYGMKYKSDDLLHPRSLQEALSEDCSAAISMDVPGKIEKVEFSCFVMGYMIVRWSVSGDTFGGKLHQDEWSMSTTPPESTLLSVFLTKLTCPLHDFTAYSPCTTLHSFMHNFVFVAKIHNYLLHYIPKPQGYHPQVFEDIFLSIRPSRSLKNRDRHFVSKRALT